MKLDAALKNKKLQLVGIDDGGICFENNFGECVFADTPEWVKKLLKIERAKYFEEGQRDVINRFKELMDICDL